MDHETIRAAKQGDPQAREVVFGWLFGALDRKLGSRRQDRYDVLQETLADILSKLEQAPDRPDALLRWAGGFLRTEKLSEYRDAQRKRAAQVKLAAQTAIDANQRPTTPRSRIAHQQWRRLALQCIKQLPELHRRALLHHFDGGTHAELAAREEISLDAAYKRLSDGKRLVRRMLHRLRVTRSAYRSPPPE